jgi:hypothetical protein
MGTREIQCNLAGVQAAGRVESLSYSTGVALCQARVALLLCDSLGAPSCLCLGITSSPHRFRSPARLAARLSFFSDGFTGSTGSTVRRSPIHAPFFTSDGTAIHGSGVNREHKCLYRAKLHLQERIFPLTKGKRNIKVWLQPSTRTGTGLEVSNESARQYAWFCG